MRCTVKLRESSHLSPLWVSFPSECLHLNYVFSTRGFSVWIEKHNLDCFNRSEHLPVVNIIIIHFVKKAAYWMDVDLLWLSCNHAWQLDRQDFISFFPYLSCQHPTESFFRRSRDSSGLLHCCSFLLNIAPPPPPPVPIGSLRL